MSGQVAIGEFVYQAQAPGGVVNQIMVPEPIRALPRPVRVRPRHDQTRIARPSVLADIVDGVARGPVQIVAEDGWGKTSILAQLAYDSSIENYSDGIAVISAWGLGVEDIEQAIFDAFYESTLPDTTQKVTPGQLRTSFADITAAIVVDDLDIPRQLVDRIMNACPECAFVSTASTQTMWSGGSVLDLVRMGPDEALKLFEQRLGRAMGTGERDEIAQFISSVADYPMAIVAAAATVSRGGTLIDMLPTLATAADPIGAVHEQVSDAFSTAETKVLSVLAAVRGAPLPPEAVGVASGVSDAETHLEALKHDGIIQKASPRYRLAESTASLLDLPDAHAATVRGLAAWCRDEPNAHKIAAAGSAIALAMRAASERSNYNGAIELGRSADAGLSLSGRWGLWSGVLDEVSSASTHAGDLFTEGWLLHQLGSRSLVTGDAAAAGAMLHQAADIRRQIGDAEGIEVTEHNLRLLPPIPPVVLPSSSSEAPTEGSGFPGWLWTMIVGIVAVVTIVLLVLPRLGATPSDDTDASASPTTISAFEDAATTSQPTSEPTSTDVPPTTIPQTDTGPPTTIPTTFGPTGTGSPTTIPTTTIPTTTIPTTTTDPPLPPNTPINGKPQPCEIRLTTPGSFTVTLDAGEVRRDADFGLTCGLALTGAPDLGAPGLVAPGLGADDLLDEHGDPVALPNTGLTTGAVLRLALLFLLIGVEVLITVGKREDEDSILTLPLSGI